jgi:hypothetical protein
MNVEYTNKQTTNESFSMTADVINLMVKCHLMTSFDQNLLQHQAVFLLSHHAVLLRPVPAATHQDGDRCQREEEGAAEKLPGEAQVSQVGRPG